MAVEAEGLVTEEVEMVLVLGDLVGAEVAQAPEIILGKGKKINPWGTKGKIWKSRSQQ